MFNKFHVDEISVYRAVCLHYKPCPGVHCGLWSVVWPTLISCVSRINGVSRMISAHGDVDLSPTSFLVLAQKSDQFRWAMHYSLPSRTW